MEKSTRPPERAFANRHHRLILLVEKVALGVLIAGVVLCHLESAHCDPFIITGAIALAAIYLILAYRPPLEKDITPVEDAASQPFIFSPAVMLFIKKLATFALAIASLALMGLTDHFPAITLAVVSAIMLIPALIIALATKLRINAVTYHFSFFTRVIVMLIMLTYLLISNAGLI